MTFDFSKLLEPQRQHVISIINSLYVNGVAADMSETGTGKTYCAAWVAKYFNSPVVVICPKVVIPTWNKVLGEFGLKSLVTTNYEKIIRGNTEWLHYTSGGKYKTDNIVINFPKDTLVILDESHKCKAYNSKTSDLLIALKNQGYKVLLLSATQATNPLEMKSFGYATTLHNLYDYKQFISSCGAYTNRFGGVQIDMADPKTVEAMGEIHHRLFKVYNIAHRMTRKMFKSIFPDNHVMAETFDMGANTEKINRVYEIMARELAALEESSENYSQHHFAIMTKARRQTELLKVPAMVDIIEDWFDEGMNPVVFLNYTDSVDALIGQLSKNKKLANQIARIVGGQTAKARQSDIELFQSDKRRIMVANIAAGNAGVSLHDLNGNHPRGALISPNFSAIQLLQALGRIHRAEAKTTCLQKIFFAADTVEHHACIKVKAKLQNLDALNDGDLDFSNCLKF